jgi:hypothetical protein
MTTRFHVAHAPGARDPQALDVTVAEDDGQTVMPKGGSPLPAITAADVETELEDSRYLKTPRMPTYLGSLLSCNA